MVSNIHNSISLLRWSKISRHSDIWIPLDADLCMDVNEYQSILSAPIWLILLHLVLLSKLNKNFAVW